MCSEDRSAAKSVPQMVRAGRRMVIWGLWAHQSIDVKGIIYKAVLHLRAGGDVSTGNALPAASKIFGEPAPLSFIIGSYRAGQPLRVAALMRRGTDRPKDARDRQAGRRALPRYSPAG